MKSTCAIAAVRKKNCKHRKILAVCPKNSRWGRPLRSKQLGLGGGTTLGEIIAPVGFAAGSMDLENAFTYVEWPEWVWYYQAGPSVRVRDAPAEVRAEFAHLGSRALGAHL